MGKEPMFTAEDYEKLGRLDSAGRWVRNVGPHTKKNYFRYMLIFNRQNGMGPDEFLTFAKTHPGFETLDLIEKTASPPLTESNRYQLKIALGSFLHYNGFNDLPKMRLGYTPLDFHRGYRKDEVRKLLGYLDNPLHKFYVLVGVESGFRAATILQIQYHHIKQDFEKGVVPVAVRFEPRFFRGKKAAGFSFLGQRSIELLKECIKGGWVKTGPIAKGTDKQIHSSPLIDLSYSGLFGVLARARDKAELDENIQINHGMRKYFEDALDRAQLDHEKKMILEGHFAGTRAKSYTGREWDELRDLYAKAYPYIDIEGVNPELETKLGAWSSEKANLEAKLGEKDLTIIEQGSRIAQLEKLLLGLPKASHKHYARIGTGIGVLERLESLENMVRKLTGKPERRRR